MYTFSKALACKSGHEFEMYYQTRDRGKQYKLVLYMYKNYNKINTSNCKLSYGGQVELACTNNYGSEQGSYTYMYGFITVGTAILMMICMSIPKLYTICCPH